MEDSAARTLERLTERAREDPDVLAVLHFGSQARRDAGPHSDVYVCLVLTPRSPTDRLDLGEKRLKYLKDFDLDISIFQELRIHNRPGPGRPYWIMSGFRPDVLDSYL